MASATNNSNPSNPPPPINSGRRGGRGDGGCNGGRNNYGRGDGRGRGRFANIQCQVCHKFGHEASFCYCRYEENHDPTQPMIYANTETTPPTQQASTQQSVIQQPSTQQAVTQKVPSVQQYMPVMAPFPYYYSQMPYVQTYFNFTSQSLLLIPLCSNSSSESVNSSSNNTTVGNSAFLPLVMLCHLPLGMLDWVILVCRCHEICIPDL